MRVVITIDTDNAAFHDEYGDEAAMEAEVIRCLHQVIRGVGDRGLTTGGTILDYNGNTCGKLELFED